MSRQVWAQAGLLLGRLLALVGQRRLYTHEHPGTEWAARSWRARLRGRSIFIRHLDTGSSNASELSIAALQNPAYDLERLGFHFVASPRHADMLLVTGPMTYNLVRAAEAAFDAMPERPRLIVTVGDDANGGGIFEDAYGVVGRLPRADMEVARIAHVSGATPPPQTILEQLCAAVDDYHSTPEAETREMDK